MSRPVRSVQGGWTDCQGAGASEGHRVRMGVRKTSGSASSNQEGRWRKHWGLDLGI